MPELYLPIPRTEVSTWVAPCVYKNTLVEISKCHIMELARLYDTERLRYQARVFIHTASSAENLFAIAQPTGILIFVLHHDTVHKHKLVSL